MEHAAVATPQDAADRRRPAEVDRALLGNQIYIAKEGLPPAVQNRLLRLAAFQNPAFYQAQALRLST